MCNKLLNIFQCATLSVALLLRAGGGGGGARASNLKFESQRKTIEPQVPHGNPWFTPVNQTYN